MSFAYPLPGRSAPDRGTTIRRGRGVSDDLTHVTVRRGVILSAVAAHADEPLPTREIPVTYFAAALARTEGGWTGRELDLDDVDDLEDLTEELRELSGDGAGPALLLLEENDEYVGLVRVDGGTGSLAEPRVFLSDRRAADGQGAAALLWEDAEVDEAEDDDSDDEGTRPVAEPVGDAGLLADLGTSAQALLDLCAEEGLLPADVLTAVAERGGFLEALDGLRDG